MAKLAAAAAAVSMLVGACGGSQAGENSSVSGTTEPLATPSTSSTTLAPTTTTTVAPTTTTTVPPDPAELREAFLDELKSAGWVAVVEPEAGWVIWFPPDWELVVSEADAVAMKAPDGGVFMVTVALDAADDNTSYDYFRKVIEYQVAEGTLREPADTDWFWLDHDFDGVDGAFDVQGVQVQRGSDPVTGEPISDEYSAPAWLYGYYNPNLRPDYGYIMQTIGVSATVFARADDIVLSFQPPGEVSP